MKEIIQWSREILAKKEKLGQQRILEHQTGKKYDKQKERFDRTLGMCWALLRMSNLIKDEFLQSYGLEAHERGVLLIWTWNEGCPPRLENMRTLQEKMERGMQAGELVACLNLLVNFYCIQNRPMHRKCCITTSKLNAHCICTTHNLGFSIPLSFKELK